jgi:hypothetical protein
MTYVVVSTLMLLLILQLEYRNQLQRLPPKSFGKMRYLSFSSAPFDKADGGKNSCIQSDWAVWYASQKNWQNSKTWCLALTRYQIHYPLVALRNRQRYFWKSSDDNDDGDNGDNDGDDSDNGNVYRCTSHFLHCCFHHLHPTVGTAKAEGAVPESQSKHSSDFRKWFGAGVGISSCLGEAAAKAASKAAAEAAAEAATEAATEAAPEAAPEAAIVGLYLRVEMVLPCLAAEAAEDAKAAPGSTEWENRKPRNYVDVMIRGVWVEGRYLTYNSI